MKLYLYMPYIPTCTMSETTVPTKYRVSTITCNGDIIKNIKRDNPPPIPSGKPRGRRGGVARQAPIVPVVKPEFKKKDTLIHLQVFFDNVRLVDSKTDDVGFIWAENGPNRSRGDNLKKPKRNAEDRKIFDNQVTVVYRFETGYKPNIKLFRNGNIHVTGIRKPEDGEFIVKLMSDEVLRIANDGFEILNKDHVSDTSLIGPSNFKIRMINSDFSVPFRVRRKDLHKLLISNVYDNICSFQPGTYPGVKLQFYWNTQYDNNEGKCLCRCEDRDHCDGKGDGSQMGCCKKITISTFESGKVLITGATSFVQVNKAYAYICKVIMSNQDILKKVVDPPSAAA